MKSPAKGFGKLPTHHSRTLNMKPETIAAYVRAMLIAHVTPLSLLETLIDELQRSIAMDRGVNLHHTRLINRQLICAQAAIAKYREETTRQLLIADGVKAAALADRGGSC